MKNLSLQSMQANPLRNVSDTTKLDARSDQSEAATNKQSFQAALSSQVQARQVQNKQPQHKHAHEGKNNSIKPNAHATTAETLANEILEAKQKNVIKIDDDPIQALQSVEKIPDAVMGLSVTSNDMVAEVSEELPVDLPSSTSPNLISAEVVVSMNPIATPTVHTPVNTLVDAHKSESSTDEVRSNTQIITSDRIPKLDDSLQLKQMVNTAQLGFVDKNVPTSVQSNSESKLFDEKTSSPNSRLFDTAFSTGKQPVVANVMNNASVNVLESIPAKEKVMGDVLIPVNAQSSGVANVLVSSQQVGSSNNIQISPGKTGWDQAISQKVVWMIGAGEQSATLTLNPPDLGPLQVVIRVNNDRADTTFISANAEVRQALENGLPILREKMNESGIQLGQANVSTNSQSQQSFQQATQGQFTRQTRGAQVNDVPQTVANGEGNSINYVSNGLVDTFA